MTLQCFAATHVTRRFRSGSSSPVVVATERGQFVAKLRGSGQGVLALVAEVIVAELAERLGLPVPERVLIELSSDFHSDDKNDELADLLHASVGLNLGFRLLDGARDAGPKDLLSIDDDFALRVLWLDGLTMNPDRTFVNSNVLFWKGRPWLIDHGAALTFQHDWSEVTDASPREPASYVGHIFEQRALLLPRVDESLGRLLSREALAAAIAQVPEQFLSEVGPERSAARSRAAYHAFLWQRLKAPRPFLRKK